MAEIGAPSAGVLNEPVIDPPVQTAAPAMGGDDALVARTVPLPRVETPLGPEAIVEKLAFASRRGRLAGFRAGQGGGLFGAAAFGQPFDRVLIADARTDGAGTVLAFRTVLLRKWPVIFVVAALFTIWPGVWLTDSLLSTYFTSYPWLGDREWMWAGMHVQTLIWYLPLAVLPLPWMARTMWRKSEAVSHDSAHRAIRKIAAEVGGRIL